MALFQKICAMTQKNSWKCVLFLFFVFLFFCFFFVFYFLFAVKRNLKKKTARKENAKKRKKRNKKHQTLNSKKTKQNKKITQGNRTLLRVYRSEILYCVWIYRSAKWYFLHKKIFFGKNESFCGCMCLFFALCPIFLFRFIFCV